MAKLNPRRILVIGAHPDDCDLKAGGSAVQWTRRGHHVCFVSMTDGRCGHQTEFGQALVKRRRAEARAAGEILGVAYHVLNHPDGELAADLATRREVVTLIRECRPDLVLTHRPNDYHPDHRYTAQLVQDAAFMVTVPGFVPRTPRLAANPVFGFLYDRFEQPHPLRADWIMPIDDVFETVLDALACHASQMFEWLPFIEGRGAEHVPTDAVGRREYLRSWYDRRLGGLAQTYREPLRQKFAAQAGRIQRIEVFQQSEYGSPMSPQLADDLFN